jgi:hypothetical protein
VTWRWCFYECSCPINAAHTSPEWGLGRLNVKEENKDKKRDTSNIIGGTLMFLFGLEFGGVNYPWDSPTVICLIVFGVSSSPKRNISVPPMIKNVPVQSMQRIPAQNGVLGDSLSSGSPLGLWQCSWNGRLLSSQSFLRGSSTSGTPRGS